MTRLIPGAACAALLLICLPAVAGVAVFTVAGIPLMNVPDQADIIELDKPSRLDARLSHGLPADKTEAADVVRQRLRTLKADYGTAYRGLLRAWRLGVERVPAVVVDGHYVVYGQPDVAQALATIRAARNHPETPP